MGEALETQTNLDILPLLDVDVNARIPCEWDSEYQCGDAKWKIVNIFECCRETWFYCDDCKDGSAEFYDGENTVSANVICGEHNHKGTVLHSTTPLEQ